MLPFDLLSVFNAQPGATLLLSPDWVILGASDDYLAATLTQRETLVGQFIFDAFPDNPHTPEANAVANVRASLETVLATKQPHEMAPQHYDVPDHTQPGQFLERHWQPRHTPVLDAQGQVQFILQSVQDITASRQAERQLRESVAAEQVARAEAEAQRQRFYETLLALPALVATYHGPDHVYTFTNPTYQRYFPTPNLLGRPLREVLPEAEGQGVLALMDRVYQTGKPSYQQELEVWLDFDGGGQPQQLFLNLLFHPLRDAQGRVDGLLDFSYDVTEQVRIRQQVEQQQQLLATVFEAAPVAIWVVQGPNYVFEVANPLMAQLLGRTVPQLLGHPYFEVLAELSSQGLPELFRRVWEQGETVYVEELAAHLAHYAPEEVGYFTFVFQPLRDAHGQVTRISCVALNVTTQVVARQQVQTFNEELAAINEEVRASNEEYQVANVALSEAQQQLRHLNEELEARVQGRTRTLQNLFAQAPMALVVLRGPQFIIEQANAQAEAIWGVGGAQVLGRPHFEAIPGSAGQGFEELLTGILATGEAVVQREVLIKLARAHTGLPSEGYYTVIFKPLFDEGQPQPSGIVVMWTETTDQVLARQQVQTLNEELAAINEELTVTNEELGESNQQLTRTNVDLDNFIYTASHDLKAPITNIEGLLLALEHELPEAGRTGDVPLMLTLMQDAVERFRRTITHLTDLSRLQKEHNPDANAVSLAPVVEAVHLDLTPLLVETQGQLTVTIPEGLTVTFAEKNLRSVVYNLLSNAFKYRHPDRLPAVHLRSWLADGYTVLEVQDNGLGLDLAQGQEKLFAMFQRLHTHVEGTGVGLYMVKRILENAGGRIEVDSQLGQGSTFRVYFQR